MDACLKDHQFIDITFTRNYLSNQNADLTNKYNAFCYRAWSLVDFLVKQKINREPLYEFITIWVVCIHREWLERNPFLFSSHEFWSTYKKIRSEPLLIFQNQSLPHHAVRDDTRFDDINWDEVSKDYSKLIFGPWDKSMAMPKRRSTIGRFFQKLGFGTRKDPPRNFLPNELDRIIGVRKDVRVLDLGCGPGNMLPYVASFLKEIDGLDTSVESLKIAKDMADRLGIKFNSINQDMRNFKSSTKYDLIVSTNSILPRRREDIEKIFVAMRQNIKGDGRLLLILPAFDACRELLRYWEDYFRKTYGNNDYVDKCVKAFLETKMLDEANLSYADDGVNAQCFHSEESIDELLKATGFKMIGELRRIEYPWEYAAQFDYGYFPKRKEIWDWFLEVAIK